VNGAQLLSGRLLGMRVILRVRGEAGNNKKNGGRGDR